MRLDPPEQFEIFLPVRISASLGLEKLPILAGWQFCSYGWLASNATLTFLLSSGLGLTTMLAIFQHARVSPTAAQYAASSYVGVLTGTIGDLVTHPAGRAYYYVLLATLFGFVNYVNILGLIPYSFAITSHFAVTFTMAFIFFLALNSTGVFYHGVRILNLFHPPGTPSTILPLPVPIESVTYVARVFSLAIRLFANITAGHISLKIIAWFAYLRSADIFVAAFPGTALMGCLWVLEFFISIPQAYVLLILLCIYLNEVLQLH